MVGADQRFIRVCTQTSFFYCLLPHGHIHCNDSLNGRRGSEAKPYFTACMGFAARPVIFNVEWATNAARYSSTTFLSQIFFLFTFLSLSFLSALWSSVLSLFACEAAVTVDVQKFDVGTKIRTACEGHGVRTPVACSYIEDLFASAQTETVVQMKTVPGGACGPAWAYEPEPLSTQWGLSMSIKTMIFVASLLGSWTSFAQDVTYRTAIVPIWRAQCIACHGAEAPERADFLLNEKAYADKSQGPRMDTYERFIAFVGWPDTGALMRRLDDGTSPYADGKPGNMYVHLGATDAQRAVNLKVFKDWVGNDAWNLNRARIRGDVPAVTLEQLNRIKLNY